MPKHPQMSGVTKGTIDVEMLKEHVTEENKSMGKLSYQLIRT